MATKAKTPIPTPEKPKPKSLKALSEDGYLDFSVLRPERIRVGDNEIVGEAIVSVRLPQKGMPAWEVRYCTNGTDVCVIYAASTPIQIEAVEIIQEQPESEEEVSTDE